MQQIDIKKWAIKVGQSLGILGIFGVIGWAVGGFRASAIAIIAALILGIFGALIT